VAFLGNIGRKIISNKVSLFMSHNS